MRLHTRHVQQPIIDGTPAEDETGVVYISHPNLPIVCSGTVIAPTLVLTSKHCVIRETTGQDIVLAPEGFQVGFGPSTEQLVWRSVTASDWIGAPDEAEVQPAVDAGEDVGLLYLATPVPPGTKIHPVNLDHTPTSGDQYKLVGYGRSSLSTGLAGTKLSTVDEASAYGRDTGIIETTGNGACDGDSGGPLLHGPDQELVGVISYVGGSDQNTFCDIGVTYASSVGNPRVNQLLANALAALPPCEELDEVCDNGQDENCNGVADDHCTEEGESCSTDVDCESDLCRDAGHGPVCVQECSELNSCRSGFQCWFIHGEVSCVPEADAGSDAGPGGAAGTAGTGAAGDAAGTAGATTSPIPDGGDYGCSCRVPAARRPRNLTGTLAALLVALRLRPAGRRRKPGRRKPRTSAKCVLICSLAVLAGSCEQGKPEKPPEPEIGVPICDEFLLKYEACIDSKVPEEQQPPLRRALEAHRAAWKSAPKNAAGKAGLRATCRHVAAITRGKVAPHGCEW